MKSLWHANKSFFSIFFKKSEVESKKFREVGSRPMCVTRKKTHVQPLLVLKTVLKPLEHNIRKIFNEVRVLLTLPQWG